MKIGLLFCCCLNAAVFAAIPVQADLKVSDLEHRDAALQSYRAGMEAARLGDDEGAIAAFESALENGFDTSRLHYNLGVVLLRMDQRAKAANAFRRAAADPELAALAEYNLGLIALQRGHWAQARDRFSRAGNAARTPGLQSLSAHALERLPPEPSSYLLMAEFSAGYDDAASIRADDLGGGKKKGDLFAGTWLYAEHWLTGNTYRGVQAFGNLFALSHADESDADLLLLGTGAVIRHPIFVWETASRLTARHSRLAGDTFDNSAELSLEGSRLLFPGDPPSGTRLSLRYRFELIDGGSRFNYLSGTKQDARIRINLPLSTGRLTADYSLEHHHRDDLRTETQFLSASPLRHRFGISYRQPLSKSLYVQSTASWRASRFSGSNTLADETTRQRKDRRLSLSGTLSHRRAGRFTPFIRGEWDSNSSNIAYYDYRQLRFSVGTEWLW